jgi:hypothetical protein
MTADAQHCPAVASRVLLVVGDGTVSQAAITRAAQLAAGAPVTVIGVGSAFLSGTEGGASPPRRGLRGLEGLVGRTVPPDGGTAGGRPPGETERVRRAVALAMSALENTGVMAYGHIAVTASPARAVARMARARGARVVVLDQRAAADTARRSAAAGGPGASPTARSGAGALAAELRRRMYGSGVVVLEAAEPAGRRAIPS